MAKDMKRKSVAMFHDYVRLLSLLEASIIKLYLWWISGYAFENKKTSPLQTGGCQCCATCRSQEDTDGAPAWDFIGGDTAPIMLMYLPYIIHVHQCIIHILQNHIHVCIYIYIIYIIQVYMYIYIYLCVCVSYISPSSFSLGNLFETPKKIPRHRQAS